MDFPIAGVSLSPFWLIGIGLVVGVLPVAGMALMVYELLHRGALKW